ncbi:MAG: hypothetical protein KC731_10470 [Myxococcales bacterium]|nr:hypothetical protein [Myxococcales bacterium]
MLGLAFVLPLLAASCGDEPPAGEGGSAASGGLGGTGGASEHEGGQGGLDEAPVISSLTTDVLVVTSYPTTVTFTAVVTDPQGAEDLEGGTLSDGSTTVATFAPSGPDEYQAQIVVDDTSDYSDNVIFVATFADLAGHLADRTVLLQVDPTGCSAQPDHASCRACFCQANPAGCAAYTQREYEYLFCGGTCSQDCSAFCQTVSDGVPDPSLIEGFCAVCMPDDADVQAFQTSCLMNVPDCFSFLVDLGDCPP